MVPDILVWIEVLPDHAPPPPAAGPSRPVFSNLSQSHCDKEFQSQKTQDTSSGITVRRDCASSHPAAGSSCPDPVYAARSLYKQAPEPNTEERLHVLDPKRSMKSSNLH